jgi:hypothetical protein
MRNVSNRSCREYEKTIYLINIFSENCATYEIKWKITIQAKLLHKVYDLNAG